MLKRKRKTKRIFAFFHVELSVVAKSIRRIYGLYQHVGKNRFRLQYIRLVFT